MKSDWLSLNLKTSLLVGAASLSAIGTTSGIFSSSNKDVLKTVKESADPIIDPFKKGYSNLSTQLDSLSKQGYNRGIDAKNWVTENFTKSKIYSGGSKVYSYLKSWSETASTFSKSFHETAVKFFKDWEENRKTMHVIFKALGNSFSLIGSLMGSMETEGESKMKMLFEVISNPKFKDFMTEISTMLSKNPDLMSQFKGDDVTDILSAFKQDPDTVHSTLQALNKDKKDGEITREVLLESLKLQSLMGRANAIMDRAKRAIASQNKEGAKQLIDEIKKIAKQIDELIAANKAEEEGVKSS